MTWNAYNKMKRKIKKKVRQIVDDTAKLLENEKEINKELESYFKVLLSPKPHKDFEQDHQA